MESVDVFCLQKPLIFGKTSDPVDMAWQDVLMMVSDLPTFVRSARGFFSLYVLSSQLPIISGDTHQLIPEGFIYPLEGFTYWRWDEFIPNIWSSSTLGDSPGLWTVPVAGLPIPKGDHVLGQCLPSKR